MANPANRLPPDFDDIHPRDYDPAFTADINTKMRIPHRLGLVDDDIIQRASFAEQAIENVQRSMNVPDRIMITGQDETVGLREELRFDMDPTLPMHRGTYVGLSTPPRSLKLDEDIYAVSPADLEARMMARTIQPPQNGYVGGKPSHNVSFVGDGDHEVEVTPKGKQPRPDLEALSTPGGGLLLNDSDDDDIAIIQRQVIKLTRHVINLQQENEKRASREFYLYTGVLSYLVLQVVKWFIRNN